MEKASIDKNDINLMRDEYINILQNTSYNESQINNLINWLDKSDFYEAPASTRFHDAFPGGLLYHHLMVYNESCDLMKLPKFSMVDSNAATLVALTHDFCKIGLYEMYYRNVKDENDGSWNQVPSYRWKSGPQFPLGHGVASMYLVSKFIPLNIEESLAIRWHMGEYNCCQNEMSELQDARDKYPLVLLLQMADRLAITEY